MSQGISAQYGVQRIQTGLLRESLIALGDLAVVHQQNRQVPGGAIG